MIFRTLIFSPLLLVALDQDKIGVSAVDHPFRGLATTCQSDSDCRDEGYCAAGVCLAFGSCAVPVDCYNPSNIHEERQEACGGGGGGHWDCQQGSCVCIEDQPCANGRTIVNCFVAPCQVAPACDVEIASCVDNYCGDCLAIQFDVAGNQVCPAPGDEPSGNNDGEQDGDPLTDGATSVRGRLCQSDSDCVSAISASASRAGDTDVYGEYYCSEAGTCLPHGSCGSLPDCSNPSNVYMVIECEGTLVCNDDDSSCGIICCQGSECDLLYGDNKNSSSSSTDSDSQDDNSLAFENKSSFLSAVLFVCISVLIIAM